LFVLPSGPPTSAAANLLFAGNMPELLARFKKDFDMVLIDTPPMLQMPDARVVGRMADGVILVTRAGKTTRDAATAARQRFSEDQIRVLGTILNDWDPRAHRMATTGITKGRLLPEHVCRAHRHRGLPIVREFWRDDVMAPV
jgi:polysaccharide biosynthesis transport protein